MAIPPIPSQLTLEIVTPDHALAHADVDEVAIPAENGYVGVLPGHTPTLVSLRVGELWYRRGTEKVFLSVAFGFAEILPDRVIVLAQVAERADQIDVNRAEEARRQAEQQLDSRGGAVDLDRARLSLLKSLVRLQVATKARTRG